MSSTGASKDKVKPGLTFTVFAAGWNGRGEGDLKATIEVIRVLDAGTSLCKVNTVYDTDGHEVAVSEELPHGACGKAPTP